MDRSRAAGLAVGLTLVLVGVSACAADEDTPAASVEPDAEEPGTKPDTSGLLAEDRGEPPEQLSVEDVVVGEGDEVAEGDEVEVHYVGLTWSGGEEFGSSWDAGRTFVFELCAGEVIPGWEQGVRGMRVGGRRVITVPPELAYGDRGAGGGRIAPGETLVFVVDVVGLGD